MKPELELEILKKKTMRILELLKLCDEEEISDEEASQKILKKIRELDEIEFLEYEDFALWVKFKLKEDIYRFGLMRMGLIKIEIIDENYEEGDCTCTTGNASAEKNSMNRVRGKDTRKP